VRLQSSTAKVFPRITTGRLLKLSSQKPAYGLGLDDVVVVVLDDEEFAGGLDAVVVLVLVFVVSLVFSFTTVEAGLTTVVLFSVLFSAGTGATVSVFCSHAPRSAAPAKMQINFFIGLVGGPCWG
jgi:hypothetical protein